MSNRTHSYNARQVQVVFNTILLEGYADGDFLTITKESDAYGDVAGTDGDVTRFDTNDRRATIEIRLMQTSLSNDPLSATHALDRNTPGGAGIGSFLVQDMNGTSLYRAGNCWIQRAPDPVFGREPQERVWVLRTPHLYEFTGGTL